MLPPPGTSTSRSPNLTTHTFADFPAEIRNNIYRRILLHPIGKVHIHIHPQYPNSLLFAPTRKDSSTTCNLCHAGNIWSATRHNRRLQTNILKTSKQIRHEALPLMLQNEFWIDGDDSFRIPRCWPERWDARLIKRLEMTRNKSHTSFYEIDACNEREIVKLFPTIEVFTTTIAIKRQGDTLVHGNVKDACSLALAWRDWGCKEIRLQVVSGESRSTMPRSATTVAIKLDEVKHDMLKFARMKPGNPRNIVTKVAKAALDQYLVMAAFFGIDVDCRAGALWPTQ